MYDIRLDRIEENGDAVKATYAVDVGVWGLEEREEILGDVQGGKDDEDEFVGYRGEGSAEVVMG